MYKFIYYPYKQYKVMYFAMLLSQGTSTTCCMQEREMAIWATIYLHHTSYLSSKVISCAI